MVNPPLFARQMAMGILISSRRMLLLCFFGAALALGGFACEGTLALVVIGGRPTAAQVPIAPVPTLKTGAPLAVVLGGAAAPARRGANATDAARPDRRGSGRGDPGLPRRASLWQPRRHAR